MAELRLIGLYLGQHFRRISSRDWQWSASRSASAKPRCPPALQPSMTTKSAVRANSLAQRRRMSLAARALDTMGAMATSCVPTRPGSSSGQARAGHHRVHARFYRGADGGGIVLGGHHRIDGHPVPRLWQGLWLSGSLQSGRGGWRLRGPGQNPAPDSLHRRWRCTPWPPQAATAPASPPRDTPTPMPPCRMGTGRAFPARVSIARSAPRCAASRLPTGRSGCRPRGAPRGASRPPDRPSGCRWWCRPQTRPGAGCRGCIFSSSILSAPAFSCRTYSRLMRFFSTRTGAPTLRPVTMVSLSLALSRAAL